MRRAALVLMALMAATGAWARDCHVTSALQAFAQTGTPPDDAVCSTYLTTAGTTATSCRWPYALRDPAAKTLAATLWQEISACRTGQALGPDTRVNHPDSYDLQEWEGPSGTFALSVKDKGNLNQTFVFIRYAPK